MDSVLLVEKAVDLFLSENQLRKVDSNQNYNYNPTIIRWL